MKPLLGIKVLAVTINLPGPLAASRLCELGADVTKIEPPGGDPLEHFRPAWYRQVVEGLTVFQLDLKQSTERDWLSELLDQSDLLLTSSRPSSLQRLGLSWETLHERYPRLCQVAIVGYPAPQEDRPGHDLNFQASCGLVTPPQLPRTLLADLVGSKDAVTAAMGLLFGRERGQDAGYAQVSLAEVAKECALPLEHRFTTPDGELGGSLPGYNLYECQDGWIALAALESQFWKRLVDELGIDEPRRQDLGKVFSQRSADEWEQWAVDRVLPVVAVRGLG